MEYDTLLKSLNISQTQLEGFLVLGAGALFVGIMVIRFWLHLIAGAFLCGVLVVFAHHPAGEPITANAAVIAKTADVIHNKTDFMKECVELTTKPDMCEDVWKDRQ